MLFKKILSWIIDSLRKHRCASQDEFRALPSLLSKSASCFFILFAIFLSGCQKDKPIIVFNSAPINKTNVYQGTKTFAPSQKIYFALLNPDGFKSDLLRMQVFKKDDKSEFWGYTYYYSKDIKIDSSLNYYLDYFTIDECGYYVLQFFYINKLGKGFAYNDFWVK